MLKKISVLLISIITISNILYIPAKAYVNHCNNCGDMISSDYCQRCNDCGWYICISCYSCGCKKSNSISNNNDSEKETIPPERLPLMFLMLCSPYLLIKLAIYFLGKADRRKIEEQFSTHSITYTKENYSHPKIDAETAKNNHIKTNISNVFQKGNKVKHYKFGIGVVVEVDKLKDKIKVSFSSGEKEFLLSTAKKYLDTMN